LISAFSYFNLSGNQPEKVHQAFMFRGMLALEDKTLEQTL